MGANAYTSTHYQILKSLISKAKFYTRWCHLHRGVKNVEL